MLSHGMTLPVLKPENKKGIVSLNEYDTSSARIIIHDAGKKFDAPYLRYAYDIIAKKVLYVDLPKLELVSGQIRVDGAETSNMPKLKKSQDIFAEKVKIFNTPELESSGFIDARCATVFNAPLLTYYDCIWAFKAKNLHVPSSEKDLHGAVFCGLKTKVSGGTSVYRGNWIDIAGEIFNVLKEKNGIYFITDKEGINRCYAVTDGFVWGMGDTEDLAVKDIQTKLYYKGKIKGR